MKLFRKKTVLVYVLAGLVGAATAQPAKPRRVWLDTDLLIGLPGPAPSEVDDAVALLMALRHPDKVEIVGISTVTHADYGYNVARKLLGWYNRTGRDIPVFRGANTAKEFGRETDATRALAGALRREKLALLAIGPLTNVATLVKNHPELVPQIEEVVVCAGRTPGLAFRPGLEKTAVGDYNFETDPEAFRTVLDAGVPVVFSGYECSVSLLLGKTDIEFLNGRSEADQWLYDQFRPWQQLNLRLFGVDGFVPWDTTPLGYLSHPQYFKFYRAIPVRVNVRPDEADPSGRTKPYLDVSYEFNSPWRVTYAYKTLPGFEELVLEALKR